MENKFKTGDRCRIINYGHLTWTIKEQHKQEFLAGYTSKKVPDNIIYETDTLYIIDFAPNYVGKEVIIESATNTQGKIQYKTDLFAWADEEQLFLL